MAMACTAGYGWLYLNLTDTTHEAGACLIKYMVNIPCPSCGATRSVLSILHGQYTQAFYWNPFGFILFAVLLACPLWILYDVIKSRSSLLNFYIKTETLLKKKQSAIPAILLVCANWCWNIYKGL
jgi:hypothetical protein